MRFNFNERKKAKNIEDIDSEYVNVIQQRYLEQQLMPYLKIGYGFIELKENAPKQMEEVFNEYIKYSCAIIDYQELSGEEWH